MGGRSDHMAKQKCVSDRSWAMLADVQRVHMLSHIICVLLPDSKWQMHDVQHAAIQHCRYAASNQVTAALESYRMLLYRSWMI